MRKIKISLRLHIFLAFLVVFLLSFSVIIITFNLVLQNYINSDATRKIRAATDSARQLASMQNSTNGVNVPLYTDDRDLVIQKIVRPLANSSDVYAALLNKNFGIEYPAVTDAPKERVMLNAITAEMKTSDYDLEESGIKRVLITDKTVYYISVIKIQVQNPDSDDTHTPYYLLLYSDVSPFIHFSDNVNTILVLILFAALLLSLITSMAISNSIIQATKKLTQFASKIGSGKYDQESFDFFDKELETLGADMNQMAEKIGKADKDQKTFFQNASHELRTPLMSIQGYAEGIKYKVFDDEDAAADVIISESQRLTGMVENLLSISRLDMANTGGQQGKKQKLDLSELLESVIEKVRGSALLSHKTIDLNFPDESVYIVGNDNDLIRAFENILSNGIRYAKQQILVTLYKEKNGSVTIRIEDDGPGIRPELIPTVFDRFVHGDDGKHGIGLALVKTIVQEHGGSVSAGNQEPPKEGAVFTIVLPVQYKSDKG